MLCNPHVTVVAFKCCRGWESVKIKVTILATPMTLHYFFPRLQMLLKLRSFSESAFHFELRISWPKIQNLGSGCKPTDVLADSNSIESVENFISVGSLQSWDGHIRSDLKCCISLAYSIMTSLSRICNNKRVSLVLSVLHGACHRRQVHGGLPSEVFEMDTLDSLVWSRH